MQSFNSIIIITKIIIKSSIRFTEMGSGLHSCTLLPATFSPSLSDVLQFSVAQVEVNKHYAKNTTMQA